VSHTFHGRDIFAPVAAHLAGGVAAARFGKLIEDYLRLDFDKPARTGRRVWAGTILKVDRFGNMVTNFSVTDFPDLDKRPFEMGVGAQRVNVLARHYAERGRGEAFLILGSSGYYEISVGQGSAAKALGCAAGAPLELTF
jgi:S-adenosylmethionine hydrolase